MEYPTQESFVSALACEMQAQVVRAEAAEAEVRRLRQEVAGWMESSYAADAEIERLLEAVDEARAEVKRLRALLETAAGYMGKAIEMGALDGCVIDPRRVLNRINEALDSR